jgi:hypothetical protein
MGNLHLGKKNIDVCARCIETVLALLKLLSFKKIFPVIFYALVVLQG